MTVRELIDHLTGIQERELKRAQAGGRLTTNGVQEAFPDFMQRVSAAIASAVNEIAKLRALRVQIAC